MVEEDKEVRSFEKVAENSEAIRNQWEVITNGITKEPMELIAGSRKFSTSVVSGQIFCRVLRESTPRNNGPSVGWSIGWLVGRSP